MTPTKLAEQKALARYRTAVLRELMTTHLLPMDGAASQVEEFSGDLLNFFWKKRGVGVAAMMIARKAWGTAWDDGAVDLLPFFHA